ncbi:hypothetical protein LFM09_49810 [Lentzea alba]|uniref:glycosyltransferase n=1 Tax=Lentzea alba TaxID=2714351 RepID=UPI0039BF8126
MTTPAVVPPLSTDVVPPAKAMSSTNDSSSSDREHDSGERSDVDSLLYGAPAMESDTGGLADVGSQSRSDSGVDVGPDRDFVSEKVVGKRTEGEDVSLLIRAEELLTQAGEQLPLSYRSAAPSHARGVRRREENRFPIAHALYQADRDGDSSLPVGDLVSELTRAQLPWTAAPLGGARMTSKTEVDGPIADPSASAAPVLDDLFIGRSLESDFAGGIDDVPRGEFRNLLALDMSPSPELGSDIDAYLSSPESARDPVVEIRTTELPDLATLVEGKMLEFPVPLIGPGVYGTRDASVPSDFLVEARQYDQGDTPDDLEIGDVQQVWAEQQYDDGFELELVETSDHAPVLEGDRPTVLIDPHRGNSGGDGGEAGEREIADIDQTVDRSTGRADASELAGQLRALVVPYEPGTPVSPLGRDAFGIRRTEPAPDFLRATGGYFFDALHADKRSDFFAKIDLTRFDERPSQESLQVKNLASRQDRVSRGRLVLSSKGWPKVQSVPHLLHSIWVGGALFDDTAARAQFRKNMTEAAELNPDFDVILWTDVSRQAIEEVGVQLATGRSLRGRFREIAEMLEWARRSRIRLVNVDEVFSTESPMTMWSELMAERARRLGAGYAAFSDVARVEILHRFGGVYTDGDNRVVGKLNKLARRVALSVDGFAMLTDHKGLVNNAGMASAARTKATQEYLSVLATRYSLPIVDLYEERYKVSDAVVVPQYETVNRSGIAHERLGDRLGYVARSGASTVSQLQRISADFILCGSDQSWHGQLVGSRDHENQVLEVSKAAAQELYRQVWNFKGVVHLEQVSGIIDELSDPDERLSAWFAAMYVFLATATGRELPSSITTFQSGLAHVSPVPTQVRSRLGTLFPRAAIDGQLPFA